MATVNTNMASEFWFLSQLHRLGYQAMVTLGNTKKVDIAVWLNDDTGLTFDVKGKISFFKGTYMHLPKTEKENHYYVFIGLEAFEEDNHKVDISTPMICYVIASKDLKHIAQDWHPAHGDGGGGYGFDPKLLLFIKDDTKISNKIKNKFIEQYGDIEIRKLQHKVLTIQEFEDKFYERKLDIKQ